MAYVTVFNAQQKNQFYVQRILLQHVCQKCILVLFLLPPIVWSLIYGIPVYLSLPTHTKQHRSISNVMWVVIMRKGRKAVTEVISTHTHKLKYTFLDVVKT